MDIVACMLWILIGFGPSAVIAYLGIRTIYSNTGDTKADYSEASHILDWLMPGFAVIAVGIKFGNAGTAQDSAILSCFLMLLTYYTVRYLLDVLILFRTNRSDKVTLKDAVKHIFWSQGKAVGILACAVFYGPMGNTNHSLAPSIYLFFAFYIAGFWGEYIANMLAQMVFRVKVINSTPLEEGELRNRINEIASSIGLAHVDISIIRDKDFEFANAVAVNLYNNSHVMFTESLVRNLSKDEVDAVVAHELGHCVDRNCWEFSNLYRYGFILIWLALMAVAERGIDSLAPSFYYLQYVKWLSLFIVPPLIMRWYSRQREQEADANYGILADPQACISGLYKLHLLSGLPLVRPKWSHWISTHPSLDQRIRQIASQYKLPGSEVEQIYASAKSDLDNQVQERYELSVVAAPDEAFEKLDLVDRNIDPFPNLNVRIASMIVGLLQWIGILILAVNIQNNISLVLMAVSTILMVVMIIGPIIWHAIRSKRVFTETSKRLHEKLYQKYGDLTDKSPALVSVKLNGRDYWQSALLVIDDKQLHLYGEVDEFEMDPGKVFYSGYQPNTDEMSRLTLAVFYTTDSVQNTLLFDTHDLAKKDKRSPKSIMQLKKLIDKHFDIKAPEQPKVPLRQLLIRIPIALTVLSLVLYIVHLIIELSGLGKVENLGGAPYIMAVIIIGGLLASWVFHTPKSESVVREVKQVVLDDDQRTREFGAW